MVQHITLLLLRCLSIGSLYSIAVESTDFKNETISLSLTGDDGVCTAESKGNLCIWRAGTTNPFTLQTPTINSLRNTIVSSSSTPSTFIVNTTDFIKTLTMKIDNKTVGSCNKETVNDSFCEFNLSPAVLPDGNSQMSFEGESKNNVPFTQPILSGNAVILSINKVAKPNVEVPPKFGIENNQLAMEYELSGDIRTVEAKLTYIDQNGDTSKSFTNNCNTIPNGHKKCIFTMTLDSFNLSATDKQKPSVPITLKVMATDTGVRVKCCGNEFIAFLALSSFA